MPENNGKPDGPHPKLDLVAPAPEPSLPPVIPPQTNTPFQFNQQVNIQQIPPKVWDKLSAEQIFDLSKAIVAQVEAMDSRHFELAREKASSAATTKRQSVIIGGVLALAGLAAATYLAASGNGIVGGIIATFLATIIAVVIGSRFVGD